jgi:hypothetical protein
MAEHAVIAAQHQGIRQSASRALCTHHCSVISHRIKQPPATVTISTECAVRDHHTLPRRSAAACTAALPLPAAAAAGAARLTTLPLRW